MIYAMEQQPLVPPCNQCDENVPGDFYTFWIPLFTQKAIFSFIVSGDRSSFPHHFRLIWVTTAMDLDLIGKQLLGSTLDVHVRNAAPRSTREGRYLGNGVQDKHSNVPGARGGKRFHVAVVPFCTILRSVRRVMWCSRSLLSLNASLELIRPLKSS
jgi:hypothetical protein